MTRLALVLCLAAAPALADAAESEVQDGDSVTALIIMGVS